MSAERVLTELAEAIEFPPTPDLENAFRRALSSRRRRTRRGIALAFAVLLVGLGALAASPARSTVLRWFGIGGVRIERVPRLPEVSRRTPVPFGRQTTLEAAREQAPYRIRLPELRGLGKPAVHIDDTVPGLLVTVVYGRPDRPRLLLSQWRANTRVYFYKLVTHSTEARRVTVNGGRGVWLSGAPHSIFYRSGDSAGSTPVYLAGNVLVWMEGPMSYRLEVDAPLPDALRIARSLD